MVSKSEWASLIKRGWVVAHDGRANVIRCVLLQNDYRLSSSLGPPGGVHLKKAERELIAFLELHPGPHNVATLDQEVKDARDGCSCSRAGDHL